MELISTPFILYREINTGETDLIEDAFGINSGFIDVIKVLEGCKPLPAEDLISSTIEHLRQLK